MSNLPSIAFTGRQGSGKTLLAQTLISQYGYHGFSWAEPVRTVTAWAYGPVHKARGYEVVRNGLPTQITGRQLLQSFATDGIRAHVDEDFWVRVGTNALDAYPEHGPWVCDDTRFPNELDALARRGWAIIRLDVPDEVREHRITLRDGSFNPSTDRHVSETLSLDLPAHLTYHNTTDPAQAAHTIIETLRRYIDAGGAFVNRTEAT